MAEMQFELRFPAWVISNVVESEMRDGITVPSIRLGDGTTIVAIFPNEDVARGFIAQHQMPGKAPYRIDDQTQLFGLLEHLKHEGAKQVHFIVKAGPGPTPAHSVSIDNLIATLKRL